MLRFYDSVKHIAAILLLFAFSSTNLHAQITASFSLSASQGCSPQVVAFTSTCTGTITGYSWNFGNGAATSVLQNPSTTYTSPGTYTVTLTVTGSGGPKTATASVTIYAAPTVSMSFTPGTGCDPLNVSFSSTITANAPGAYTQLWDFQDGNTSTSSNPSHVYTYGSTGIYHPILKVTNSVGCVTTIVSTNAITLSPKATVSFTASPTAFCTTSGTSAFSGSVTGGASPYTYAWDFGDGGGFGPGGLTTSHSYAALGSFTVQLKVTDANGCITTATKPGLISTHQNVASFTGPSTACISKPQGNPASPYYLPSATFTNNSSSGNLSATTWDFGDGTTGSGASVAHAYKATGSFIVKMNSPNNGCNDTLSKTIIINPGPTGTLSYSPQPNCPVPAAINFSASGGTSYSWTWKSGGSSTSATPSKTYLSAPFKDTATVIVKNIYGCTDSVWDSVIIHNIRTVVIGSDRGCAPLTYTPVLHIFDDATMSGAYPYPNPAALYWDFGDGDTSTATYPIHVYQTAGIYRRIVKITTTNGCVVWDTGYVHVGNLYKPSFVITPDTVCVNTSVFFQNTSSKQHSSTLVYRWDLGVSYFSVDSQNAILAYSTPGIFTIKLYADSNGCMDSAMCVNCLVVRPPNASFYDSVFCPPNEHMVQFQNSSIGATSNLWSFGDGSTSSLVSPQHTYPSYGNYTAQLITYNSVYGCSDTMNWLVKITNSGIDFHAVDTTLCKDDTLQLIHSSSGTATLTRLIWSVDSLSVFNDTLMKGANYLMKLWASGTPNGLATPVLGFHDVKLIAVFQNFGQYICYDTIVKRNYFIVSHPAPAFSASPSIGCTPLTATFIDSTIWTTGTQWSYLLWRFGDGDTLRSLAASTTHTYAKSGLFNPRLIAADWNGCIDSFYFPSSIQSRKPKAVFGVPSLRSCIGKTIPFSDSSQSAAMLSYAWTFGDGDTSSSINPSHAYKNVGVYSVRLIVADITGCSDTMTKIIRVTQPKASFSLSDTFGICPPLVVSFTSTSFGAVQYTWDFRNSGSASIANPTSTFYNPGVYNVRLIVVDSGGCADTASHQLRVLGYAGAFDYPATSGCVPLTVNFTCKITGVANITWDFADGTTQKGIGLTSSHTYLYPGAYVPKLIFSDDSVGCKSSSIGLDTIKVDGVIAGFKALPPCEKSPILLVDTSFSFFSPIKYSRWDFGAAGQALGNPISKNYPAAGKYPVKLISTNLRGCSDTLSDSITIYPLPIVVAMSDTSVCIPDAIVLSVKGAKTYAWLPSDSLSCANCPNPIANPTKASSYIVTGTDNFGCANKDTVNIGIQTKTTFTTNADGAICLGETFRLFAIGATVYNWTPSEQLDSPKSAHPIAHPQSNTNYIVIAKEGSCAADTQVVQVIVHPLPTVNAGADVKIIAGKTTLLQASGSGISKVLWSGDSTLSCYECYGPEAKPLKTTTYHLTGFNEFGCRSTDSITVFVLCDGSQLFIPNTFSPNGDGHNDRFFPRGDGIKLINSFRIYSRWGELLYERKDMEVNDESAGWDGIRNGRILNPDVFVYVIEATCESDAPILFKGDVTLLK